MKEGGNNVWNNVQTCTLSPMNRTHLEDDLRCQTQGDSTHSENDDMMAETWYIYHSVHEHSIQRKTLHVFVRSRSLCVCVHMFPYYFAYNYYFKRQTIANVCRVVSRFVAFRVAAFDACRRRLSSPLSVFLTRSLCPCGGGTLGWLLLLLPAAGVCVLRGLTIALYSYYTCCRICPVYLVPYVLTTAVRTRTAERS